MLVWTPLRGGGPRCVGVGVGKCVGTSLYNYVRVEGAWAASSARAGSRLGSQCQ